MLLDAQFTAKVISGRHVYRTFNTQRHAMSSSPTGTGTGPTHAAATAVGDVRRSRCPCARGWLATRTPSFPTDSTTPRSYKSTGNSRLVFYIHTHTKLPTRSNHTTQLGNSRLVFSFSIYIHAHTKLPTRFNHTTQLQVYR